jgi:hypothetical protein
VTCSRLKARDLGFLAILFTLIQLVPGWTKEAQDNLEEYSIVVTKPEAVYTIDVHGVVDPENIEIDVENLGDQPVVNPRMTVNGLYDWYDVKTLVNEITRDCQTDEEKALAIWSWVHWKRFQREPHDDSSLNPVRGLNGYGYGICGHTSAWLKSLLTAGGVKARVWEITGHTISEAFYNGAWHMLDGNVKVFYLDRDNRTIASLATLEHDQWLIERTIHVTDPWFRGPDAPERNGEFIHYIITNKDNWESDGYDYEINKPYTMAITLKPGEKLIRWWKPVLEKFEGRDKDPLMPERYANGRLFCALVKQGNSSLDQAEIFFGEPQWDNGDLYRYLWGKGTKNLEIDLDPSFLKHGVLYNYSIVFTLRGNAKSNPPTQAGVDHFRVITDLQVSPHSLPALSLGKNVIRYWDSSPGPRMVRITHRWRELNDRRPPEKVQNALNPSDGGEVATLTPTLRWADATYPDTSDKVTDYQVMVSLRPDCRWPLSPTLHQNAGFAKPEWQVPATFLNPGTVYYWKVRARGGRGDIGEWSRVFRFKTEGNSK